jgi:hypothetical protein
VLAPTRGRGRDGSEYDTPETLKQVRLVSIDVQVTHFDLGFSHAGAARVQIRVVILVRQQQGPVARVSHDG